MDWTIFLGYLAVERAKCGDVSVTVSLGVSGIGLGARDPRELLDQADKSLYAAKHEGRNRVVRFDEVPENVERDDAEVGRQEAAHEREEPAMIPYPAVSALMSALSFQDSDTAEHSQRVADLCSLVARDLMSPSEAYLLEMAAMLHDIGKIGVPDAILQKRGALTEEERGVMRTHDQIGVAIVQEAFGVEALTALVGSHHAWFGGNPDNPSLPVGEDIPLGARLLGIAEAYDAMVFDSVYRPAMSSDRAFEELRAGAGKQFDPSLVDRFIAEVKARDASVNDSADTLPNDVVTGIAGGAEGLAKALEKQDAPAVAVIAQRLNLIAAKHNASELGEAAEQLQVLASENGDLLELAARIGDLMEMCREMQRHYLNAHDTNQPRVAPRDSATAAEHD